MAKAKRTIVHGARDLPAVTVDSSNIGMSDAEGYIGDHASGRAFRTILQDLRHELCKHGDDPLGNATYGHISKKEMDAFLIRGEPEAAGVVQGAIEEFAHELASIVGRFLEAEWKDTERVVVGGGLRDSRVGEIAIGRTTTLLKTSGKRLELVPIRHHPDDAGLLGVVHLVPTDALAGFDGMLGVDIGGSNIRAGIVRFSDPHDLSDAGIGKRERWRHRDDDPPPSREEAIERLIEMLKGLAVDAEEDGCRLAPFVGVGCPGTIGRDGSIERGSQNLPGDWEEKGFNLARLICGQLPRIGGRPTDVILHNDAVVQGLSQAPFMRDVERWGVLTIGTGLGNARFTNRG